eukprot:1983490-Rhodomonas_salina.1
MYRSLEHSPCHSVQRLNAHTPNTPETRKNRRERQRETKTATTPETMQERGREAEEGGAGRRGRPGVNAAAAMQDAAVVHKRLPLTALCVTRHAHRAYGTEHWARSCSGGGEERREKRGAEEERGEGMGR